MMDKLLDIVKVGAPMVASVLGTPAAGAVVAMMADKLGCGDTVDAVVDHLTKNPQDVNKLRELDLKQFELENQDRASARNREIEMAKLDVAWITKNLTSLLALGTLFFAFSLTGVISFVDIPKEQEQIVIYALGFVSNAATLVLGYYFGASQQKDKK